MNTRSPTPICGAASPAPGASSIVSARSATSLRSSLSKSVTAVGRGAQHRVAEQADRLDGHPAKSIDEVHSTRSIDEPVASHVDSAAYGPGVFFRLGALRQHDTISITRADGLVAEFAVERVVEYPKAQFPTFAVYGNTDNAALRLITCGGIFDPSVHSYESNIVAYAALVSTHRA